ncbi:MAG: 4-hydroxy-3-methylbut-2-enyl diphosphate reductase [Candidatus Omnitrophota bacterium]|nr:MAG: 4-hydroxy-3-methylbut-2-enyl diphosphate reductase [Candidatus Omnitrophota bacterium]
MQINVAQSAGFCFGVKRALGIALKTARSGIAIEMLGDIVHNEDVVREVTKVGIKKIKRLGEGTNKILLIRAHGVPQKTLKEARKRGYTIIDATCPMVKEIHEIAKGAEQNGYKVIIIGDHKHDEVRGIIGQLKNKAVVIEDVKDIPLKKVKNIKKAAVVVQSTQNIEEVTKIANVLKRAIGELKFFNTICQPTQTKQREIKGMPLENDVMIIIGSKTSANTKRLYQISKSLNKKSYWVKSKKDIRGEWFKGAHRVGITAGASTPDIATKTIIEHIKKMNR